MSDAKQLLWPYQKIEPFVRSQVSDTPRTDAQVFYRSGEPLVAPEFARDLERELVKQVEFALESASAEMLDAMRYRYLRDRAMSKHDGPTVCQGFSDLFEYLLGADVDGAVDAAMAEERQA